MADIKDELLLIYFKDLKKPCQKKVREFLTNNEVDGTEVVYSSEVPVIIIGWTDDAPDMKHANSMVT